MLESKVTSSEEAIMTFESLTGNVEEADKLGSFESLACLIVPKQFCNETGKDQRYMSNRAKFCALTACPEVSNRFLSSYASAAAICNAANNLQNICYHHQEDHVACIERINDAASRLVNVNDEIHTILCLKIRSL